MSIRSELLRALDVTIVPHPAFVAHEKQLNQTLQDHQAGVTPYISMLIGPSRIGKSEILQRLARQYPQSRKDGRLFKPVLLISIPNGTTPKDLPLSVIQALGIPVPKERSRAGVLFDTMLKNLRLANTMAILFDEASHLVDTGSRVPPRQASDWFKSLLDEARVSIVMSGVPRLRRLLDSNEQLRGRCKRPLELMPYYWSRNDERKLFAGCAQAFTKIFQDHGCPIQPLVNTDTLMRHLYAVSVGNVGLLSNYFKALASQVSAPGPINLQTLHRASTEVNLPANGMLQPFEQDSIPDEHLLQALMSELSIYDISLPIDSPHATLAAHRNQVSAVPA
ncbi:AAA family ATPase [Azoarcus communis]|uniref:TniB family NTP-binding protein n=1 Tax=Parazoarcus communis TaxID=41977 RepID=UPI001459825E|nr:AAA family ATPase [Parazoarcus communis]